jgi:hypothetical protein
MTTMLPIPAALPMTGHFFHVNAAGFSVGHVIEPGHFGQLHAQDSAEEQLADRNGERLRERIREAEFSGKPSRMRSVFVWETLDDARTFRGRHRQGCAIYRVAFTNPAAEPHRVCAGSFFMPTPEENMVQPERLARLFWESPSVRSANNEVFAESAVTIVAIEDPGTVVAPMRASSP